MIQSVLTQPRFLFLPLSRVALVTSCLVFYTGCSSLDAMRRVEVDFDLVSNVAQQRSERAFSPSLALPEALAELDYDGYRKIRFDEESELWKAEDLPFRLQMFHRGFLHTERVLLNEFTATHSQRVPYLREFFVFDDPEIEQAVPNNLGFAGFKLVERRPGEDRGDEFASFVGASYFRGTGSETRYGSSARGIAVDAGLGRPEEFPSFREFWVQKPSPRSERLLVYALLDGPSVTGAYEFVIQPGVETVMDVKVRLFFRNSVESLGIAPLTSMFWRGENRQPTESDYRPEVHDSDGLVVWEQGEEPIWRPLDHGGETRLSYFAVEELAGFGLMQRDRSFGSYQDAEALYHMRPSVWVQPINGMIGGRVRLVELPTSSEYEDNIVAYWEPSESPKEGDEMAISYRLHWTSREPAEIDTSYVMSTVMGTRQGIDQAYPGTHVFVIDFSGEEAWGQPKLNLPESFRGAELVDQSVAWNPFEGAWRVTLRVRPAEGESVSELSCQLEFSDRGGSEVWAYQWHP